MKTEEIFEYVQKQYGTVPEYLWSKSPDSVVLRHKNGKWYAVFMTVEKSKLGLEGNDLVAIMDVKCDPEMTSMIIQTYGFLPGYHMNKQHWITILLDGSERKKNENSDSIRICASWKYRKISKEDCRRMSDGFD